MSGTVAGEVASIVQLKSYKCWVRYICKIFPTGHRTTRGVRSPQRPEMEGKWASQQGACTEHGLGSSGQSTGPEEGERIQEDVCDGSVYLEMCV